MYGRTGTAGVLLAFSTIGYFFKSFPADCDAVLERDQDREQFLPRTRTQPVKLLHAAFVHVLGFQKKKGWRLFAALPTKRVCRDK